MHLVTTDIPNKVACCSFRAQRKQYPLQLEYGTTKSEYLNIIFQHTPHKHVFLLHRNQQENNLQRFFHNNNIDTKDSLCHLQTFLEGVPTALSTDTTFLSYLLHHLSTCLFSHGLSYNQCIMTFDPIIIG